MPIIKPIKPSATERSVMKPLTPIDIKGQTRDVQEEWRNWILCHTNDHVVRVSVMSRDFHWHAHADSDETFLAFEGGTYVDLEDRTIALEPGQLLTIPRGVRHRTRPMRGRAVTLTFEHYGTEVTGG